MTKKYICKACFDPCILEVGNGADKPIECPYKQSNYCDWVLFERGD